MGDLTEVLPGVHRWTVRHPEWEPDDGWEPTVAAWAQTGPEGVVLIDPLVDPDGSAWAELDALVTAHGPVRAVIRTLHDHQRSVAEAATRYGAPVHARPRPRADVPAHPRDVLIDDGTTLPGGAVAHWVNRDDEIALELPEAGALLFADVGRRVDGRFELCPDWWLDTPHDTWIELRHRLAELAGRARPTHLLVEHGAVVLGDGAELGRAITRAAARPLPPFVAPDDLAERRPHHHLLDARLYLDGRDEAAGYATAHLPGAVHLPFTTALSDPPGPTARRGRHPLPSPERFAAALSAAGVSHGDTVVAYDDAGGVMAARLVWLLRRLGEDAAVLAPTPPRTRWTDAPTPAPEPGRFGPRPWPEAAFADLAAVADRDPTTVLIDPRAPARFRGETEPLDPRPGHIPGGVNLPYAETIDADGALRPRNALRRRFLDAGVGRGALIAACGSGVTACHTLLLVEQLHLGEGRLYPGSYSEWSRRTDLPVATGP